PGEQAVAVELHPATEAALPLRLDWRNERDPLAGVLASVDPAPGERIVCRLVLTPAPSNSAHGVRRREEQPAYARRAYERGPSVSLAPVVAFMALSAVGLQGWRWYEAGEWAWLAAAAGASFVAVPLLGAVAMRLFRGR